MHGHVVRRHAQPLRHPVPGGLGRLEAAPHLALAPGDADGRGGRLHGRVGEVRGVVLGLEAARGAGHGRVDVAVVAHDLPGLARGLLQRRLEGHRVVARVRAVVPRDLQRLPALHGGPGVAGDHPDAAQRIELGGRRAGLDRHHLHDARHLERLGRVEARHLAAVHRRARHDRVEHPVQARVDAVLRLAGDDVPAVDELQLALADVAELRRILEAHRVPGRDRQPGRGLGERAVPGAPARRAMHDLVVLRLHFLHGHVPPGGGGRLEHGAGGRAAAAHGVEEMPRAPRAVGVLVAEALLVAGRLRDADALPVGFQLVGHDHGHAGPHALPHLGAVAHDGDGAVLGDGDERERIVDPAVRHAVGAVLGRLGAARAGRQARPPAPAPRGRTCPGGTGAGSRWRSRAITSGSITRPLGRPRGALMSSLLAGPPPA